MKKHFYYLFLSLIIFTINCSQIHANSVAGGMIEFTHKGGSIYNIKVTAFIDKGQAPSSPSLYINNFINVSIYDNGPVPDALKQNVKLDYVSITDLDYKDKECVSGFTLSTSKVIFSADVTLNKALYTNPAGYYIIWADGDRNKTVNANSSQGMLFLLKIPPLNAQDNSSPVFKLDKGIVACVGKSFSIDLGATDPDASNTRTYKLVIPYSGPALNTFTFKRTLPTPRNSVGGFTPVAWNTGFSDTSPMGAGVTLDPSTGILSGTAPTVKGKYLVVVECKEFRGSTEIGSNRMDFEIIVDDCNNPKPLVYLEGTPAVHLNSLVICEGSTRVLETASNTGFTYQWQKGGVDIPGATKFQLKVFGDATTGGGGEYTVKVTRPAGSACGAGTETSLKTDLTPQAGENVKLDPTTKAFCEGDQTTLTILQKSTGAALGGFNKVWYKDNVLLSGVGGQFYNTGKKGYYKVVVTQFIDPKCSFTDSVEINAIPLPEAKITNVTNRTKICDGEVVKLSARQATGVVYQWVKDGADIPAPTGKSPDLDVKQSGVYGLRVEDALGICDAFANPTVTVTVTPYPTVTFAPIAPICNTKSAKINLQPLVTPFYSGGGIFTGNGIVNGYEFDPIVSGYGSFKLTYSFRTAEGCEKSADQTVIVDQVPTVRLGSDVTIFRGESVQIKSVGSTGSKYLYEWTPATGLDSPNAYQPIASPVKETTYVVKVSSVFSKCFVNDKMTIFVRAILDIPSAFTPNNDLDAKNETWKILDNNQQILDYPNMEVKVYNRWGNEIFSSIGAREYEREPFNGIQKGERLPAGTYFYVIKPSPDVPPLTGYVTIIR
jgi:gliding motility-associated-like protein